MTPEYISWTHMKSRCGKKKAWKDITYCERWESFDNFLEDMGERPDGTSLDRINPKGNYEPGNCRWATSLEQQNNRTNNVRYDIDGEMLTLPQISRKTGVSIGKLKYRVYIKKMPMQMAIINGGV